MKKSNSKGFMLAETLIVSSFIAVILIYLFVQFRYVNIHYGKTLKYNGVNEIYALNEIKKYIENLDLAALSYDISHNGSNYFILSDCTEPFFIDRNYCESLFNHAGIVKAIYMDSTNIITSTNFSQGFNDFLETISPKEGMYVLAAEFENDNYASLKVNGFASKTLEENLKNETIYIDVSSGPGLYYDATDINNTTYVFKSDDATKLNNNIEVFGYSGRIISIDRKGVKAYLESKQNVIYDNSQSFFTSDSLLSSGNYINRSSSNSSLFSILNSNLEENDLVLSNTTYGVGNIENIVGNSLKYIMISENKTLYKTDLSNYIATLNVSDIIRASLNSDCDYNNISNSCLLDNWLSNNLWTMNYSDYNHIWSIYNNEFISSEINTNKTRNAYMIVYLNPNLFVIGDGSKEFPYIVK